MMPLVNFAVTAVASPRYFALMDGRMGLRYAAGGGMMSSGSPLPPAQTGFLAER